MLTRSLNFFIVTKESLTVTSSSNERLCSQFCSFCWNYATDTFYVNYAMSFAIMQILSFYHNYASDCFCCNYAVKSCCSTYAGNSFCSKYVGDNFYCNYAGGSLFYNYADDIVFGALSK